MNDVAPLPPITGSVSLAVPVEHAFAVFTGDINTWWPHQFHIGAADIAEVILEPRVGGRWYERGVDDSECDWGRVLVWEPPHRIVFTWQINGTWQYDPDPTKASEIEARFRSDGDHQSIVDVEHRLFERLDGGDAIRGAINGGGGWALLLEGYATSVKDHA
ncbi:Activator of Hsp90 ATPase 1 family protein [Pseudonocardia dioxanivorans CB1190]|uniref:Activator of Hsp90 ATPase 1 family protein n=1 Tax=Pseudonocardia dioxanivorans (strain ATCC 55486 / DSM 44775 / JCM 13855 / CB1190) TaxID=675635 RepID=F4CXD1_PSEUX|nr:SRPBCC family protein [Pseudonocardia dioxanivorans]AEA26505.1 Activator of Hsp90 ATPase 1 family protein [Pseudonocardia dioxanivorans CB1190]